jgi:hypothetical protein
MLLTIDPDDARELVRRLKGHRSVWITVAGTEQ